jgi:hypothetical protein
LSLKGSFSLTTIAVVEVQGERGQLKPASTKVGLESRLTAEGATSPNTTLQPQLTQT